jgi:hypothetical protein
MGQNDYHVRADGSIGKGLATTRELEGVVQEITSLDEARKLYEAIEAQVQTIHDRTLPMLKGKGFIVVDPKNTRSNYEEFEQLTDAQQEASDIAYASGTAIIYAPIEVVKPQRPTASSQPSELLKQLSLPNGAPVAVTDGTPK